MDNFPYADIVVDGKPLKDWLKSDEGLVDYKKCEFRHNVSTSPDIIIYDLGEYEHDPSVGITHYHNGVDLARVAGCILYKEPYKGMSPITALNGSDYVNVVYGSFKDATTQDFIVYYVHLLNGDIYISDTNYHVFLKGRPADSEEEWKAVVDELYSRAWKKNC